MRYTTAGAFRTALEQRLLALSREEGISLVRLRKLVVFDRLLARLLVAAPGRWTVKGALALHLRLGPRYRTTKDMDLARQDTEHASTADFLTAQSVDLGDYFTFAIERAGVVDPAMEGAAVRYHAMAELAGRRFEDVTVDVGFGDPAAIAPEMLRGPDLLGFAGIQAAEVPTLSLEQHIAEKVHAYTRSYGAGTTSSRVKDLIDMAVIASRFSFSAAKVRQALDATFEARGTHALPTALPPPPSRWRIPYQRMAQDVGLPPDLSSGLQTVKAFLDRVLAGELPDTARWDSVGQVWRIAG